MKKELSWYYISRTIISTLLAYLLIRAGWPIWSGVLIGLVTFVLFIWYAHSGYFLVDASKPLTPLKRDARARTIRDRSLLSAVVIGGVIYGILGLLGQITTLAPEIKNLALVIGVIAYFVISQVLFARDARQ